MIDTPVYICGYRPEALKKARKFFKNFTVVDFKIRSPRHSKYPYMSFEDLLFQSDKYLDTKSILIPVTEKGVLIKSQLLQKMGLAEESYFLERFIDKTKMKEHCQMYRIPITPYAQCEISSPEEIEPSFGYPVYVKKNISSGSRHQRIAQNMEELQSFWQPGFIVEKNIEGKEFSIESFVQNGQVLFKNITTYHKHHISNILPGIFSDADQKRIFDFNSKIIQMFKVQNGLIHVECFLQNDQIIFGEIAIRPPGGFLMKLIEKSYGFEPWVEYFKLFLNQAVCTQQTSKGFSSVWILHPGEGKVKDIWGMEDVIKDSNLFKYKLKFEKGDYLKKRIGSGESYGYFLFHSHNLESLLRSLESIEANLQIIMNDF